MMRVWTLPLFVLLASCSLFEPRNTVARKTVREENLVNNARPDNGPRKRVLILPFLDAAPDRSPEFRERARQAFLQRLNRGGELLAVDSTELKIDPSKFIEREQYKMKDIAPAAKELGVSAVLEGKILDIKIKRKSGTIGIVRKLTTAFEVQVSVRLANVRGGREIFNTIKTVTVEQDDVRVAERVETDRFIKENPQILETIVRDAFLDFVPQITATLAKVTWEGRIAALNGDRVYLNVGRLSGVQVGDLLKVFEEGEDIFDPEFGSHIGKVPGRLKGTLEVVSYFGTDGSIAIVHSGAGFKENDRVELYQ